MYRNFIIYLFPFQLEQVIIKEIEFQVQKIWESRRWCNLWCINTIGTLRSIAANS